MSDKSPSPDDTQRDRADTRKRLNQSEIQETIERIENGQATSDDAKEMLREFAKQLHCLSFPKSPISIDLAKYFAGAIDRYLEHGKRPMDVELGLSRGRGRPKDSRHREKVARKVHAMLLEGLTWKEVAENVSDELGITDERVPQEYYREFKARLLLEDYPIEADELIRMIHDGEEGGNSG